MGATIISGLKCYQTVPVTIDLSPVGGGHSIFILFLFFPMINTTWTPNGKKAVQLPNKTCFLGKYEEQAHYLFPPQASKKSRLWKEMQ